MTWTEIKKWAKDQGYNGTKQKDDSLNGASYYWSKVSDTNINGISPSVSKFARDIYNDITNKKWLQHQINYQISKEINEIKIN